MIAVDQIITFLKYVFSFGYAYYQEKREKFLLQSLEDEQAVYAILELIGENLEADRVELVYMHNGGGRLVPGVEKYVKVASEVCITNKLMPRNIYHSRKVDNSFLAKVSKMMFCDNSTILVNVQDLSKGFLKSIYTDEGVKQFIATYVASNEKYMWYISLNYANIARETITEEEQQDLDEYRGRIVEILKKYFNIGHRC